MQYGGIGSAARGQRARRTRARVAECLVTQHRQAEARGQCLESFDIAWIERGAIGIVQVAHHDQAGRGTNRSLDRGGERSRRAWPLEGTHRPPEHRRSDPVRLVPGRLDQHFGALGAEVEPVLVRDRADANDAGAVTTTRPPGAEMRAASTRSSA